MTDRIKKRYGGLDGNVVYDLCTKLLAAVEAMPDSRDLEKRRHAAQIVLRGAAMMAEADPCTPLANALNGLVAAIQSYVILGLPVIAATDNVRKALTATLGQPAPQGASMTERIANARYGGLDNAGVYDLCTKLLAVVAALPESDDFEERRQAAHSAVQVSLTLARADPHTPLSDALYALAAAIDLYIHFRQRFGHEAGDVRDALDQTMR